MRPPLCDRCGRPLPGGGPCPLCRDWPGDIDGVRSVFRFDGAVRQAVHSLKYRNVKALAHPLAQLMAEYLACQRLPVDVVVPVPLHPARLRRRGYNQSQLLASELAGLASLPLVEGALRRTKDTPPQARSGGIEERHGNVADAFACRGSEVRGRHCLLVDDVYTSGATLGACAAALKAAGAREVWGLTLAMEI